VYSTRPLLELLQQHAPRTLADAEGCVQRLALEVPRLKCLAARLQRDSSSEAAALLSKVDLGGVACRRDAAKRVSLVSWIAGLQAY
jgi:hypothetical protein